MEEDIKEQLREFLEFDSNWYAALTALSISAGIQSEEEFDKFVEGVDIEESWDEYYIEFQKLYTEKELKEMIPVMRKLFDSEQMAFAAIEKRVDNYLENQISPILH